MRGILKAFSAVGSKFLDAAGLNIFQDIRDINVSRYALIKLTLSRAKSEIYFSLSSGWLNKG